MRVNLGIFLRKIRLVPLLLGIALVGLPYYYFFVRDTSTDTTSSQTNATAIVSSGSLKETIDAVGTAKLVDEQSLKFNQQGTITKVNVKAGQTIKKGDVIAEIDASDAESSVKQAQISLENAQIAYDQIFDAPDASKVLQSKSSISNTKTNLQLARQELENLKNTQATDLSDALKDIENAQTEVDNLQISQQKVIQDSNQDIQNQISDLEIAQKSLELSQKNYELSQKQLENSLGNTLSTKSSTVQQIEESFSSELTSMQKIVEQLDYILGVSEENKLKNDTFELYLSAKNSQVLNQAKTSLTHALAQYQSVAGLVKSYDNSGQKAKMLEVLGGFQSLYKTLDLACDLTYQAVDASVASSELSETDIENKKSTVYNSRTTVQSKLSSTLKTINELDTLSDTDLVAESNSNSLQKQQDDLQVQKISMQKKQATLESTKTALEITKKNQALELEKKIQALNTTKNKYQDLVKSQDLALKTKIQSLSSQQESLQVNEYSYEELLEGPTSLEISKAKNSIEQAKIQLENAKENLDDYKLEAPFDGVVRKIDYMVGDNLTSDSDKYIYIENPNLLEITVHLDQVDISKVSVDTRAVITFDAYPDLDVIAKISNIDTTPVQTSGVTTYTVTLVLDDESFEKKVLSGMTADVEIIASEKSNILMVSTQALITKDEKTYVMLRKNGQYVQTPVTIGIASEGKTEIISGLKAGDTVQIQTVKVSESTTSTSSFGPGAGGPPGGF